MSKQSDISTENVGSDQFQLAIQLARKGRYAEAIQAIQRSLADEQCSELEAVDLQARIYSQQGCYLQAESCWISARNLDPDNPEYDRAIARLRISGNAPDRILRFITSGILFAMLCMLIWQLSVVNPYMSKEFRENRSSTEAVRNAISDVDATLQSANQNTGEREMALAELMQEIASSQRVSIQNLSAAETRLYEHYETQLRRLATLEIDVEYLSSRFNESQNKLQKMIINDETSLNHRLDEMHAQMIDIKAAIGQPK
jgi:tetratricopeptide (TPR) repeat protein